MALKGLDTIPLEEIIKQFLVTVYYKHREIIANVRDIESTLKMYMASVLEHQPNLISR